MQSDTPTPPFARRSLTFAHVASQIAASTGPPEKLAHNKLFAATAPARRSTSPSPSISRLSSFAPKSLRSSRWLAASRRYGATNFSRPDTCSRNEAPTVAVAQTDRR
jgi:hypothetical protein